MNVFEKWEDKEEYIRELAEEHIFQIIQKTLLLNKILEKSSNG